ncbi:MAG TPA: hypothetical protein VL979_03185 [Solirubrobacteraceae bacterium]|nr:hypothetical protein [Solirubrobacteraceae bacterium]
MSRKTRRVALVLTLMGALAVSAGASATALASVAFPFKNWAVWGSLTPAKLNEPVTLPKGSTFNGEALVSLKPPFEGTLEGGITVPPFTASLKLVGIIPTTVGTTFTQVGTAQGTIVPAPAGDCPEGRFGGECVTLKVATKAILGITATGIFGVELPTKCETAEPLDLNLTDTLTSTELVEVGTHFTGVVTLPPIRCEGLSVLLAPALTLLLSGPNNPYDLHITPQEPGPPTSVTEPASGVSQVSAKLNGMVNPNGEPLTGCAFEYGTGTAYGHSVPCSYLPKGRWSDYAQLSGLSEGTTYDYRVVGTNPLGTTQGENQTFTTLSAAAAPEYGQCVAQKKGNYVDPGCTQFAEKHGQPVEHRGHYEFQPGPAPTCAPQKKGDYTDAGCTTKAAKPGKGSYEVEPGPGYTSTTGAVTLQAPSLGKSVVCSAGSGVGEITGVHSGLERFTLTGCQASGKKCTSEGVNGTGSPTPGVIVTNELRTRLLGPVEGQVWVQLSSGEHEPYLAEFGCEGVRVRTVGSIAGVQSGDVGLPSTSSSTAFELSTGEHELSAGEQALFSAYSLNAGKSWSSAFSTIALAASTNTAAAATEIRP